MSNLTFRTANDETLAKAIRATRRRLVYVAPGITKPVAEAIDILMQRSEAPAVTLIIDTNPEVCRLGFGTVAGLKHLQALARCHHLPIRYQAGLRIGLLVSDDEMLVYAPTPLLIEAGSQRDDHPNAIALDTIDPLQQLLTACAAEGNVDQNAPPPAAAEIGTQAASPERVQQSLASLERQPPKPYDVARIERVYSSKLQYVELEVKGYRLASRRVQIPSDLLVGTDNNINERLRNSFALLKDKQSFEVMIPVFDPESAAPKHDEEGRALEVVYSEQKMEEDRKAIYQDFLITVPGHGQLIHVEHRKEFEARIKWFHARVEAFGKAIQGSISQLIEKEIETLANMMLPTIKTRTPPRIKKFMLGNGLSDNLLKQLIADELRKEFQGWGVFYQPIIKLNFKNLSYETFADDEFRNKLAAKYGFRDRSQLDQLFEEHDAAPEAFSSGANE